MAVDLFTGKEIQARTLDAQASTSKAIDLFTGKEIQKEKKPETFVGMLGHNAKEAAKSTYAEVLAPIVHGSSTLAFGVPKKVSEMTGTKDIIFPEQTTPQGKFTRGVFETFGFLRGGAIRGGKLLLSAAKAKIPSLAGGGILKTSARLGIEGTAAGALQTPEDGDVLNIPGRLKQSAGWGFISASLPGAQKIAVEAGKPIVGIVAKTGRWVARNMGGITDATVGIIKRLGADRVFSPEKEQADYIGKYLVPRFKQRIVGLITNFSPKTRNVLKNLGVDETEIDRLSSVDKSKLAQLTDMFGKDWQSISTGLERIRESANLQFRKTLESNPDAKIYPKNMFYNLQNLLREQGWITPQGNEIIGAGVANKTKSNLIKIYYNLKKTLSLKGKKRLVGYLNPQEYFNKLSELEASLSGNPKFDRIVFTAEEKLRKDAIKAIPALEKANKAYADSKTLLDLEKLFNKVSTPTLLERQMRQLRDPSKFQLHLRYKNILGNDIYDDLLAHLANQDFGLVSNTPGVGGGVYTGRSGLIKAGVSQATKGYYKVKPKIQKTIGKSKSLVQELVD